MTCNKIKLGIVHAIMSKNLISSLTLNRDLYAMSLQTGEKIDKNRKKFVSLIASQLPF